MNAVYFHSETRGEPTILCQYLLLSSGDKHQGGGGAGAAAGSGRRLPAAREARRDTQASDVGGAAPDAAAQPGGRADYQLVRARADGSDIDVSRHHALSVSNLQSIKASTSYGLFLTLFLDAGGANSSIFLHSNYRIRPN